MTNALSILTDPFTVVFAVATVGGFVVLRWLTRKPSRQQLRLRELEADDPALTAPDDGLFGPLTPALAAQIPESEKERRDFQRLLRQAGLYRPSARATIYAMRFLLLLVPLVIAGVMAVESDSDRTWPILITGAIAAAALSVVPRLYVFFRRRRRMQRIRQGLPDTIDMLGMCSSGGLGMSESLEHVAGQLDSYPELAEELRILRRQAEVGNLDQALADLTARVDLPEIRQLSALLRRGTRLGTQLSGSLNDQADHLRVARRQAAMTQANKTPVKLVLPILFCFAPAALILLTAPAMLELRDFLVPRQQATTTGEGFGTGAIFDALDTLDQGAEAPQFRSPTADEWH